MSETMHRSRLEWTDGPNKGIKGMMCPWCHAEADGYDDLEFDSSAIHVRYTCTGCGREFVETYEYEATYHFTYEEES